MYILAHRVLHCFFYLCMYVLIVVYFFFFFSFSWIQYWSRINFINSFVWVFSLCFHNSVVSMFVQNLYIDLFACAYVALWLCWVSIKPGARMLNAYGFINKSLSLNCKYDFGILSINSRHHTTIFTHSTRFSRVYIPVCFSVICTCMDWCTVCTLIRTYRHICTNNTSIRKPLRFGVNMNGYG